MLGEPTLTTDKLKTSETQSIQTPAHKTGETPWSTGRLNVVYKETQEKQQQQPPQEITAYSTRRITALMFATNPTREQTAASEQIEVQMKEAIEQKYNIAIEGHWTKEQLIVLKKALQNLQDNFALAHPGKQTVFITDSLWTDNAYCLCLTMINNPLVEPDNYKVNIETNLLRNQKVANIMAVHEITHARSLIILIANGEIDEEYVPILWYQDEIERIVGMPFSKFALITKIKLKLQYPELYDLSQQRRTITQEGHRNQKIPESFIEQVIALEWRSFNEVFMYYMEDVVSKEMAEELYDFLKIQIFERVEYTQDGKPIKPPQRQEITPLHRG